jgi:hypothetical protein
VKFSSIPDEAIARKKGVTTVSWEMLLPVALGGLIGAGSSLIAIQQRLRFDRAEKERERSHALKKEALLQVAQAIAGAQTFIAEFARTDISPERHEESLRGLAGWLERVHLVAEVETVEALSGAADYFSAAAAELALLRGGIAAVDLKLKSKENERHQLQQFQGNLASIVRSLSPQPQNPGIVADALLLIRETQARLEKLEVDVQILAGERWAKQLAFTRTGVEKANEFQSACIPAKILIRRELGISPVSETFEAILTASLSRRGQTVGEFLRRLDELARSSDPSLRIPDNHPLSGSQ